MFKIIQKAYSDIKADYNKIGKIRQADKRLCYRRIAVNLLWGIWNAVSTPFIYPIWYIWKKSITEKIYKGTTWQEIEGLMNNAAIDEVETKLKANGKFLFWLWTYGDCTDPLGWGGMPTDYGSKKNNFINRYRWSAIRNPRFNINYMYFRTGIIEETIVVTDTRNFQLWHQSYGIGGCPDGIIFQWYRDNNNRWNFIYEIANEKNMFWFGYVGQLYGVTSNRARFETSYRKTENTYTGDWHP